MNVPICPCIILNLYLSSRYKIGYNTCKNIAKNNATRGEHKRSNDHVTTPPTVVPFKILSLLPISVIQESSLTQFLQVKSTFLLPTSYPQALIILSFGEKSRTHCILVLPSLTVRHEHRFSNSSQDPAIVLRTEDKLQYGLSTV